MGKLDGKIIIITGAARGQGAAEARLATAEGATVVLTDVLDEEGTGVAAELDAEYHRLDVSSAGSWAEVVKAVMDAHGRVDGLVNNAGIFRRDTLLNGTEDTFRLVQEVNQMGVFNGLAAVAPSCKISRVAPSSISPPSLGCAALPRSLTLRASGRCEA